MPWKRVRKLFGKLFKRRESVRETFRTWGGLYGEMYWKSVERMVGGFNKVERKEFETAHTNFVARRDELVAALKEIQPELFRRFGKNSDELIVVVAKMIRTSMGPNIKPVKRANLLLSGKPKKGLRLTDKLKRRIPIVKGSEPRVYENSVTVPLRKKTVRVTFKEDPSGSFIIIKPEKGK